MSYRPKISISDISATGTADSTTYLRGDGIWATVSGGGGSGTVTSFSAGSLSPLFTTSVATSTTTPALSFALSNAAAHTFLGNNTGSTGAPAYVSITVADLPDLSSIYQPVLGYTPVTNARTITINGTTQDLSANRTWTLSTSDISEGTNLYYTSARFNTAFAAKSTSDLTEGSNLYYTDARARASISLTTTGTSGAATYNSTTGVLNIPQYSTSVAWGSITGTLSSQTDLQTALNAKQNSLGYTPEDVANKSTSTALGTSNTLYPSQNAVKSYVDTAITNLASSGTVQNAYLTNITLDDTTNASEYITWAQGNTSFLAQKVSTALRFNPSTGTLSSTTFSGALSGNATTATTLQTARNINGVSFNGSADITITAAAGTLTGTTLNSTVVTSSLTSVGTIATGVWHGTAIADTYISSASNWNTAYTNRITSLTTTGSSGSATLVSNTLNIPTYTLAGLGGVPTTTTVNGHALSSNVAVTADDVLPTQTGNSGKFLTTNGTTASWATVSGSGTVTSVDMTLPSWLSVSGNPITTSGTLAITAATGQTANRFLATPNGSTGAVSLRAMVIADLPATGTPSSTTYLRGDGTWSTPAGGGGSNPVIYVQTADVSVTNSTTETNMLGTGNGSATLSAGLTNHIGDHIEIYASGQFILPGSASGNSVWKLYYGSTVLATSATLDISSATGGWVAGTGNWEFKGVIITRTTGTTGTVMVTGQINFTILASGNPTFPYPYTAKMDNVTATTVDLTATQAITLTQKFSTAQAGKTMNGKNCVIKYYGTP